METYKYSRICSKHFVNGKKVNLPESESYIPKLSLPKRSQQKPRRKIAYRGKIQKTNSLLLAMLAAEPNLHYHTENDHDTSTCTKTGPDCEIPNDYPCKTNSVDQSYSENSHSSCKMTVSSLDASTQHDVSDFLPLPSHSSSTHRDEHDYCFKTEMPEVPNPCSGLESLRLHSARLASKVEEQTIELNSLKAKIGKLQGEIDRFRKREFSLDSIKVDDKAIQFYTGFPSYAALLAFHKFVERKAEKLQYWRNSHEAAKSYDYQKQQKLKPGRKRNNSSLDELFMVLVKLKVGLFVQDIAARFYISVAHFSRVFTTWINFLHHELKLLFPFPTQTQITEALPQECVQYPTTRVIIDCTEVFVEVPSSLLAQSQTWSNYKHHNTFKALVGISPNGAVTFVSDLYGGRISDKEITKKSGLCDLLDSGDNVMADRGFEIKSILPHGVDLNIPPFKGHRAQLTATEVQDTMDIASVRIHVERAIGRIKNYHILDGVLPLSLTKVSNQVFTVCSYLTNFLPPLLPPKK